MPEVIYRAVNLRNPDESHRIYDSDSIRGDKALWSRVIPDDAPNDLKYRLMNGPGYSLMQYDENTSAFEPIPLRPPEMQYRDARVKTLNGRTQSAFEFWEVELMLAYIAEYAAQRENDDFDLPNWYLDEFMTNFKDFLDNRKAEYDAIVFDYFM